MVLKILTIADIVRPEVLELSGEEALFKGIDLIISCGDLPPEYLSKLLHHYNAPVLYVLGNHDVRYQTSPPSGCQCIDRQLFTFNGIRIAGFSGSRWYNGGMNQYTEKEMARFVGKMRFAFWRRGTPDIVVSHASPRYVNDEEDPCHKGFKTFVKVINKYSPSYFLHGHIHKLFKNAPERIATVKTTKVINCYGFYILEI